MDNESEVIHQQMEETRTALQDKLETLEQQVKNTVQDATEAVSDTVATVKDAVQDTVDSVKGTVHETVESVKDTFDIAGHVQTHPWPMFLGATALGFVAGRMLNRVVASTPAAAMAAVPSPVQEYRPNGIPTGNGFANGGYTQQEVAQPQQPKQSWWSWLADHYGEEISKVKGLAVGTIGGIIREMVTSSVAPALAGQIKEVVDGTTVKLGGQVVEGPILSTTEPKSDSPSSEGPDSSFAANAGRSTGTSWR